MPAMFDLSGRCAVVTGARRGIGLAMAEALAAAGADIVAVSAQLETSGSEVEQAVRRHGRSFTGHRVDLADRAAVTALAARLAAGRPVDILVNNAGTIRRAPAVEHTDDDFDQVLNVNLSAPFVLAREVGRGMLERGSGKIIFTASLLSFQGGINVPGYTAAKSAIAGLTRALANEWSGHGVNVNAIAPGYIATEMTPVEEPKFQRYWVEDAPMQRFGLPDELGPSVVFLASAASAFMTGEVLVIDGGYSVF